MRYIILDLVIMSEDSPTQRPLVENKDVEHNGEKRDGTQLILKSFLGVPGGIAFLFGTIVGSGIFATPKWVLFYVGSVGISSVM